MAVHLFGAIDVGSYVYELKIFELSRKGGIRQIDNIRHMMDLGTDTYHTGKISRSRLAELKRTLAESAATMKNYGVEAYKAYGTSAFREIRTDLITKDYIERRTGLKLALLSNSEQRFLDYKSIASQTASFEEVIKKGTAIVDIGGSSLQISMFDKDKLITTQNVRIGKIASRSKFYPLAKNNEHFENLLQELLAVRPGPVMERFKIRNGELQGEELLQEVCRGRGFLLKGGNYDYDRCCQVVLDEFRAGKCGRISLEVPEG